MTNNYQVTIVGTDDRKRRQINAEGADPMQAHKSVYLKLSKYEEIEEMEDVDGNKVFELRRGFITKA